MVQGLNPTFEERPAQAATSKRKTGRHLLCWLKRELDSTAMTSSAKVLRGRKIQAVRSDSGQILKETLF